MCHYTLIALFVWVASRAMAQDATRLVNLDFEEPELGWSQWPDDSQARYELDGAVA